MKFISFITLLVVLINCTGEKASEGDSLYNQGKYKQAINAYDAYLEYHPGDLEVTYNKGRALEALKDFNKAFALYEQVLNMDDRHLYALQSVGQYHYRNKDYENAHYYFDKAVKVDIDNAFSHYLLGNSNQKLGKIREALKNYGAAISINKDYGSAYLARGTAKIILKQKSGACNDFTIARNLEIVEAEKALIKYCD